MALEIVLKVRAATLDMLRDAVRRRVQEFFDDPYGVTDAKHDSEIASYEMALMDACADLEIDFWAVVREEATEFERRRVWSMTHISP